MTRRQWDVLVAVVKLASALISLAHLLSVAIPRAMPNAENPNYLHTRINLVDDQIGPHRYQFAGAAGQAKATSIRKQRQAVTSNQQFLSDPGSCARIFLCDMAGDPGDIVPGRRQPLDDHGWRRGGGGASNSPWLRRRSQARMSSWVT